METSIFMTLIHYPTLTGGGIILVTFRGNMRVFFFFFFFVTEPYNSLWYGKKDFLFLFVVSFNDILFVFLFNSQLIQLCNL